MDTVETMDDIIDDFDDVENVTASASMRKKQQFPPELVGFTFADRGFLICGNEKDPTGRSNENYLEVAQKIEGYNDDNYCIIIDTLLAGNLRRLGKQFGLKNLGSRTKFEIRLALAEKKTVAIATILMHLQQVQILQRTIRRI